MAERQITLDNALEADAARKAHYRALIQEGMDDLARGEGIEVTDVEAWLDTLDARGRTDMHRHAPGGADRVNTRLDDSAAAEVR